MLESANFKKLFTIITILVMTPTDLASNFMVLWLVVDHL
jgi:hypothetical protein